MYAILEKDGYRIYRSWQAKRPAPPRLRVAVLKLDHVGDFWMALGPLRLLRQLFPAAHLTLVTGSWNVPAAERLGLADEILAFDYFPRVPLKADRRARPAQPAVPGLGAEPFDLAIDLRVPLETRAVLQSLPAACKAAIADRQRMPWVDIAVPPLPTKLRWSPLYKLALRLGLPPALRPWLDPTFRARRANLQHMEEMLSFLVAKTAGAFAEAAVATTPQHRRCRPIVIAPASNSELRDWPAERFGKLVALLAGSNSPVSLVGRPDDAGILGAVAATAVSSGAGAGAVTITSDLADGSFIDHLAGARLVISNNSGAGHVAARLGVPTLGIYTASHLPDLWGFRGPRVSMLVSGIACGGCGLDRVRHCPERVRCKHEIGPEDVRAEVEALLAATGGNDAPAPVADLASI